jgi:hypothetical protein
VPFFLYAGAAIAYASFVVSKFDASLLSRPSAPEWVLATGRLRARTRVQPGQ